MKKEGRDAWDIASGFMNVIDEAKKLTEALEDAKARLRLSENELLPILRVNGGAILHDRRILVISMNPASATEEVHIINPVDSINAELPKAKDKVADAAE
jgi:hypothetical protein